VVPPEPIVWNGSFFDVAASISLRHCADEHTSARKKYVRLEYRRYRVA
jgi:hypothetical protein